MRDITMTTTIAEDLTTEELEPIWAWQREAKLYCRDVRTPYYTDWSAIPSRIEDWSDATWAQVPGDIIPERHQWRREAWEKAYQASADRPPYCPPSGLPANPRKQAAMHALVARHKKERARARYAAEWEVRHGLPRNATHEQIRDAYVAQREAEEGICSDAAVRMLSREARTAEDAEAFAYCAIALDPELIPAQRLEARRECARIIAAAQT